MATIKEVMEEIYADISRHDLECFATHVSADFIEHEDVPGGSAPGSEGVLAWFQMLIDAFPDVRFDPADILVTDDKAAARVRFTGTNTGAAFMGLPVQGKSVDFELIDIMRFEGEQIAEHWGVSDTLTFMQQLGAVPTPEG